MPRPSWFERVRKEWNPQCPMFWQPRRRLSLNRAECQPDSADGVGADLPERLLHDGRLFAVAVLLVVGAADKPARDVDVVAAAKPRGCEFAQAVPSHDAVPLRALLPLALSVLPRTLSGNRKDGVRSVLLW